MYAESDEFWFLGVVVIATLAVCSISGFIGLAIANNKSTSALAGFWLGFFFGPIGWIVTALLNPTQTLPRRQISGQHQAPTQSRAQSESPVTKDGDLSEADYQIWLVREYRIEKNDVLGRFYCAGNLFTTIEEALDYVHTLECAKRAEAAQRAIKAEADRKSRLIEAEADKKRRLKELEERKRAAQERWKRTRKYWITLWILMGLGMVYGIYVRDSQVQAEREACAVNPACVTTDTGGDALKQGLTGLAWTQSDNGSYIKWDEARDWCAAKSGGWRLPSADELLSIYDQSVLVKTSCGAFTCSVSPLFRLTGRWFWSGDMAASSAAWYVNLSDGRRNSGPEQTSHRPRALCVRRS
jgi:hypothetical protein